MDGNFFLKFQQQIKNSSDNELKKIYYTVVDEMDFRSWEKNRKQNDVEVNSELQSDWDFV